MTILSIVSSLLKLADWLAGQAERKQLINQGERNAISLSTSNSLAVMQRAKKRRKDISNMSDGDLDSEL